MLLLLLREKSYDIVRYRQLVVEKEVVPRYFFHAKETYEKRKALAWNVNDNGRGEREWMWSKVIKENSSKKRL